jgi:CelD/BcsL family acetyltransferase involved in cellulose biosynthesis
MPLAFPRWRETGARDAAGQGKPWSAAGAGARLSDHARPVSLRAEWHPFERLAALVEPWAALAARALEPNVFYEPTFALAAAPVFGRRLGALLVWSNSEDSRLLGLFPARLEARRYGVPLPMLVGWTHPYAPLGAPLIDRDHAEAVLAAALDFLAGDPKLPDLLLLPFAPAGGPFACALATALLERNGRSASFGRHARACLAPPLDRAGYLQRALPGKKRKELRRQARRLAERGPMYVVSISEPSRIGEALDAFLALEDAGWKGRAKTAAARDAHVSHFVRRAVQALSGAGQARIDRLMLGDRPIAAAIVLRSGATAWFWKIAYDEARAPASPGVQLTLELTRSLLADPGLARVDSCATPEHPMIDHLWRERLTLTDQLIAVRPQARLRFALACRLETARRSAIGAAKWARAHTLGR